MNGYYKEKFHVNHLWELKGWLIILTMSVKTKVKGTKGLLKNAKPNKFPQPIGAKVTSYGASETLKYLHVTEIKRGWITEIGFSLHPLW